MRLRAVLTEARQRYLVAYEGALRDYRERYQPSAPEVLLQLSDASDTAFIHRMFRADLASGAVTPPNMTEVNIDGYPEFDPFTDKHESGITVAVSPFAWNGLELTAANFNPDSRSLRDWCWKWLDPDDRFKPDDTGFSGVIHSVLIVSATPDACIFSVDCGSAPIQALDELLVLLHESGVKHVWLAASVAEDGT